MNLSLGLKSEWLERDLWFKSSVSLPMLYYFLLTLLFQTHFSLLLSPSLVSASKENIFRAKTAYSPRKSLPLHGSLYESFPKPYGPVANSQRCSRLLL